MNCDRAFDLMTDPAFDDCAELHAHLDGCPRCGQMYETLSPALGLFAASGTEGGDASDEHGSSGGVEIAERVAVRLAREAPARSASLRPRRPLQAWSCVLAAGLVLMSAISLTAPRSGAPAAPSASDRCTWLHREAVPVDQRAEAVVLSCVACHAAREQMQEAATSSGPLLPWTEWSVPSLVEIQPLPSFDDPAWLDRAVWPTEPIAHT